MSEHLATITEAAAIPATVFLVYKKSVLETDHEREIECYSLNQGKQDILLRAYQLSPAEGWRYFMLHKIAKARKGREFHPRKVVSITTGEVKPTHSPWPAWTEAIERYRDLVREVLADMEVSNAEASALERFRAEHSITRQQMRSVHYQVFHQCLGTLLADGIIEDSEVEHSILINECLAKCGAGVP